MLLYRVTDALVFSHWPRKFCLYFILENITSPTNVSKYIHLLVLIKYYTT
jgi:hypothetical protein